MHPSKIHKFASNISQRTSRHRQTIKQLDNDSKTHIRQGLRTTDEEARTVRVHAIRATSTSEKIIKSQRTNSTFTNSNTQADAFVGKRAIFCDPQLKRKRQSKQPYSYPILSQYVPSHLGQGGNLSESSSNLITSPQLVHLYVPFPGFSPVRYITQKFKRLINLFTSFVFVKWRHFPTMILHVGFYSFRFPIFGSLFGSSIANNTHVPKLFVLFMLLLPALRVVCNSNINDFIAVLQFILVIITFAHSRKISINKNLCHLLLTEKEKFSSLTKKKYFQLIHY